MRTRLYNAYILGLALFAVFVLAPLEAGARFVVGRRRVNG